MLVRCCDHLSQTDALSLHQLGRAVSIEVFSSDDGFQKQCGGLYGVASGGAFSAESMFHLVGDASKAAVCALVALLNQFRYQLLDIQQSSAHLTALGAVEIERSEYLVRLADVVNAPCRFADSPTEPIPYTEISRLGPAKSEPTTAGRPTRP